MNTIFKNAPQARDKDIVNRILILVLSVISAAFLFAPVIVSFISNFTQGTSSVAYSIFKGLFALSLIICAAITFATRRVASMLLPCILGLVTVIFPLFESIKDYSYIKSIAEKFSFDQDYTAYLIAMGIYLAYAILCIFSAFYVTGIIKSSIFVTLMSVVSSLGTLFIAIDKGTNYDTTTFDVLTFASATITTLIPFVAVLGCKRNVSEESNKAKRYKK